MIKDRRLIKKEELKLIVAIPSMWRPDRVHTKGIFPSADVVVPESQVEAYSKNYSNVVWHPDTVLGIVAKRNWILDYYFNLWYDCVYMIDDDMKKFGNLQSSKYTYIKDEKRIMNIIYNTMITANDLWTNMFTFNTRLDYRKYEAYKEFAFSTSWKWWQYGIMNTGMRFDERIQLHEDIDFSLQVIHKYRFIYRDMRYGYVFDKTFGNPGWCSLIRNTEKLEKSAKVMEKKWWRAVKVDRRDARFTIDINL